MLSNCGAVEVLLRVPWTTRRSNQSILKEINPECSLEGPTLKLKLQYYGHLIQSVDSSEKTLMLEKTEGRRRRGQQRMRWHHWLNGHEFEQALGDSEGQGSLACHSPWGHKELDTTEWLNWAELKQPFRKVPVKCSCVVSTTSRLKWLGTVEYMQYHKQQLWLSYLGTKVSSTLAHKNHNHNRI